LSPNTLDLILIIGFTATVVGGLDSLPGAVIGGLLVGLIISFVNVYLSPEDVFLAILALLLSVLIFKPQGLFGTKDSRRV
jgi:branched-chain amino acid transport system permease protein